jgi:putative NADH-flavin reductase
MKVLVVDAGHETGHAVVDASLEAGHDVTAVVTEGSVTPARRDRLEVVTLNGDRSVLEQAVAASDAVVSVVQVDHRRPTTRYSDVAADVVEAVEAVEQTGRPCRVLCVSSSQVDPDGPGLSLLRRLYVKLIIHRRYRNTINDMRRMENEVRRSPAVDWTVVRPAPLEDGPATGRYRTAVDAHVPGGRSISKGDLAQYIATHLDDESTSRSVVELAY